MVKARDGGRAAVRFGAVALGAAAALTAALAPAALPDPDALLRNTVAYPLGLTGAASPAQSPLPGHLLSRSARPGTPPRSPCSPWRAWRWSCRWSSRRPPARLGGHQDRPRAHRAVRPVAGDEVRLLLLPARALRLGRPLRSRAAHRPRASVTPDAPSAPGCPASGHRPPAEDRPKAAGHKDPSAIRFRAASVCGMPCPRGLEPVGDLRRRVRPEPLIESLEAGGQHFPGFGHQRPVRRPG